MLTEKLREPKRRHISFSPASLVGMVKERRQIVFHFPEQQGSPPQHSGNLRIQPLLEKRNQLMSEEIAVKSQILIARIVLK